MMYLHFTNRVMQSRHPLTTIDLHFWSATFDVSLRKSEKVIRNEVTEVLAFDDVIDARLIQGLMCHECFG